MNKLFNFLLIFICLIGAETVSEHGSAEWQKSRMYVHIEESQRDDFLNWIKTLKNVRNIKLFIG